LFSSRRSQLLAGFQSRCTLSSEIFKHFGGFLQAQPAEKAQFDDPASRESPHPGRTNSD
jgi:hypothetical protein